MAEDGDSGGGSGGTPDVKPVHLSEAYVHSLASLGLERLQNEPGRLHSEAKAVEEVRWRGERIRGWALGALLLVEARTVLCSGTRSGYTYRRTGHQAQQYDTRGYLMLTLLRLPTNRTAYAQKEQTP